MLLDTFELPDRPAPLKEDDNDAQTREHEEQNQGRATTVEAHENRKKTDLVIPSDDTSLQQPHVHSS